MLSKKLQSELLVGSLDLVTSMAYVSAIREVADAEQSEDFAFDRKSYETLADAIDIMSKGVDGVFAEAYCAVANDVRSYAQSL